MVAVPSRTGGAFHGLNTFLSQTAEYALRAMTWIAGHPLGEPLLTRDLSEGTQIPTHYLSKILRRLVLADLLESRKGRGGGFILARPPGEISFRDVLVAVDAYPREDRCAFGWGTCDPSRPCPLHASWSRMSEHFRNWAERSTFADVHRLARARRRVAIKLRSSPPKRSRTR